ncbi:PAS domain-containing protein [Gramella sp. GC03-9]|uniref:histidine kinase n=1 Tax=Christiangramia oceanisediminis TaxID=2920386 RepID=A0A9X2KYS9_9FLAO|nr:PAS domain-containing protein [Gramella oceanisediminis]MCP9200878.1 PAS domain-containing protein [Gramella oceanisediminis]
MDLNQTRLGVMGKSPQYLEKLIQALANLNIPEKNILKFPEFLPLANSDLSLVFVVIHELDPTDETLDAIESLLSIYPNLVIVHPKSIDLNQTYHDLGVRHSIFLDEINPYSVHKCLRYSSKREKRSPLDQPDSDHNPFRTSGYSGKWEFDLLSKNISWDETINKLFHIAPTSGQIPLEIWKSMVHPEDRIKLETQLEKAILNHTVFDSAFRINSKGENYRYFHIKAVVNRDRFKRPLKLVGSIQETTSTEKKREKLLNTLKEKREILDSICTGFCTIDRNWKITDWNNAAVHITGIKKSSAIGEDLRLSFQLDSDEFFSEKVSSCFHSMKPVHFEHYQPLFKKWLDYSIRIKKDKLLVFFRDITSEKEKEIELQALRRLQNDVINSTSGHIWAVDQNFNLMLANDSFFQDMKKISVIPYGIGSKVGSQLNGSSDFSAKSRKKWYRAYKKALNGESMKMKSEVSLRNKRKKHYQVIMSPIRSDARDNQKITGVACFSSDITTRVRQVKALKAKNRKLKEIAWMHSHLLRAPVTKILGLIDIIQQSWHSKEELNRLLHFLKEASQELDELTKKITAASEKS